MTTSSGTRPTAARRAPARRAPVRRPRRPGRWLLALLVIALVAVTVPIYRELHHATAGPAVCSTTAAATGGNGVSYTLTPAQMANAATIAAVGRREGLPDHAVTVALATALQESKLRNLSYGDRDSVGLFQQRPSQGWGTPAQLQNTVFASTAFYARLKRVPDWQSAAVTDAAQAVQHSGAPDAYAYWEPEARALARALTGEVGAGVTCLDVPKSLPVTSVAALAQAELGRSIAPAPATPAQGWGDANWLVTHAPQLGLEQVSYRGQTWTRDRGTWAGTRAAGNRLDYTTN